MASGTARRAAWVCILSTLLAGLSAVPASAAPGDPLGPAFLVGSVGVRLRPVVARAPSGAFVVAYQNFGSLDNGVSAQRFHADGSADGPIIQVVPPSTAAVQDLSVATDDAGVFVVAWTEFSGTAVAKARRFAADNSAGAPFLLDGGSTQVRFSGSPAVAMGADGRFVITWLRSVSSGVIDYNLPIPGCLNGELLELVDPSIMFRRYAADGTALGPAPQTAMVKPGAGAEIDLCLLLQVDPYVSSLGPYGGTTLGNPVIAKGPAGDFAIAWAVSDGLGAVVNFVPAVLGPSHVSIQRYTADGLPLGAQLVVHQTPGLLDGYVADLEPRIAQGASGTALVWSTSTFASGSNNYVVRLRSFGPLGLPQQLLAATAASGKQAFPWGDFLADVAVLPSGAVTAWRSTTRAGTVASQHISAQLADARGAALGAPIDVADSADINSLILGPPAVVSDSSGDFAVFWTTLNSDGSQVLMYGRLFSGH